MLARLEHLTVGAQAVLQQLEKMIRETDALAKKIAEELEKGP